MFALLAVLVGASGDGISAQFASGVSLVEVYVSVTDRAGEPVTSLGASNFRIAEDGVPQTITAFASGTVPLSVVIALDRSFSMAGERLTLAKAAARAFISALRSDDEVAVLAIGSDVQTILPPVPVGAAAATSWDAIDAWGTTPLLDVILQGLDMPRTATHRRALLLISDGADRDSRATDAEVVDRARRAGVLVYGVGIGRVRPPIFAELAGVTGGRSFLVDGPVRLEPTLAAIARELRSQYLLGYVPARPPSQNTEAGGWRAIEVTVDRTELRVRARDGYFAR